MRLHRLAVTAFGPFASRQDVDFDLLGADRLFLLHGETGAGKTSILDAVAFALFGRLPGARGEAKRLRCDLADPGTRTEVELELTIGGERLRIVRSPEQERIKQRGSGTTQENAKVVLEAEDERGGWTTVTTRINDAAEYLQRRVGMSADQFFQVVLLPQGEFARFLRAEAEDRVELLRKLFRSERFGAVEEWFVKQRREAKQRLDEADGELAALLARLAEASGVEADADGLTAPLEWVEGVVVGAQESLAAASDSVERARLTLEEATDKHRRTADLRRRQDRLIEALAARAKVEAGRAAHEAVTVELEDAERAARVHPVIEAAAARASAADAAKALAATGTTELLVADPTAPVVAPADLRAWERTLRDEVAQLEALLATSAEQAADTTSLKAFELRRGDAARRLEALGLERDLLPARLEEALARVQEARSAADRLPGLRQRVAELEGVNDAAGRLVALAPRLAELEQSHLTAQRTSLDAERVLLDLRKRRLDGMAAELAGQLAAGTACPVCGGAEHPSPAVFAGEPVRPADEKTAEAVVAAAAKDEKNARAAFDEAQREKARLDGVIGGRDVAAVGGALDGCRKEASAAQDLADLLESKIAAYEALAARSSELASDAEAFGLELAQLDAQITSVSDAMRRRQGQLDVARQQDASIDARIARLGRLADQAGALADAVTEADRQAGEATDAAAAAAKSAAAEGFSGPDTAAAAVRTPEQLASLRAARTSFDEADRGTKARLEDEEFDALEIEPLAEPAATELALTAAQVAYQDADRALHAGERSLAAIGRLRSSLVDALTRREPLLRRHEQVSALADLLSGLGQNAKRMRLEAFVLAARLEEVAAIAGQRLRAMSGGRYSFVHTDSSGPRNTRGGLGLDVLDDFSGQTRSAKTLSGGESFMASLALALGLADAVAAESGGTQLDTLFIDEGFGSLDPESLDQVMGTLDELRAGGRVIGLVSHVEELRTRIPVRLRIVAGRGGSRVQADAV